MKYKTDNGYTITPCPYKPEKFAGGFACALCEHWGGASYHISGEFFGRNGPAVWFVRCTLEPGTEKRMIRLGDPPNMYDQIDDTIPAFAGVDDLGDLIGPLNKSELDEIEQQCKEKEE